MKSPFHNDGCALLIGINDYSTFDSTKARDLKGSVNDVVAAARFCKALGMAPENVRVVCDNIDADSPDQLSSQRMSDTSQKGIREQLTWLGKQLESGRKCLLWYSGHGAHTKEDGLLLCPSDTTANLGNTIPFKAMREILGNKALKNLTVVLDCCYGGSSTDALGRPSTTLTAETVPDSLKDDADVKIGAIVLTACDVGETSQQSQFASHWHGAFAWALLAVADQWKKAQEARNERLDMTYRELIKKATILLDALEFNGTPQIYPRSAGGLAVLQLEMRHPAGQADPNLRVGGIDYDFTTYTFRLEDSGANILSEGEMFSVGNTSPGRSFQAGKEYWLFADYDLFAKFVSQEFQNLCIHLRYLKWTNQNEGSLAGESAAVLDAKVSWTELKAPVSGTRYARNTGINFSNYTAPTSQNVGSVTITWYLYASAPPAFGTYAIDYTFVNGKGTVPFTTRAPANNDGFKWYMNQQTITIPKLASS